MVVQFLLSCEEVGVINQKVILVKVKKAAIPFGSKHQKIVKGERLSETGQKGVPIPLSLTICLQLKDFGSNLLIFLNIRYFANFYISMHGIVPCVLFFMFNQAIKAMSAHYYLYFLILLVFSGLEVKLKPVSRERLGDRIQNHRIAQHRRYLQEVVM